MRGGALTLAVLMLLGCSGLVQKLSDMGPDVKFGEDAVHPADFPLPPPASGTLWSSMVTELAGVRMEVVQYDYDGTDPAPILDPYEQLMLDAGMEVQRSANMVTGMRGESESWSAAATGDPAAGLISLTVSRPLSR